MAKAANKPGFPTRLMAFLRNETTQSIAAVVLFATSVYMLIAMGSFLLSGSDDYSLLDLSAEQLRDGKEHFSNVCGQAGAQLADWMINRQFGLCGFFIPIFLLQLSAYLFHQKKDHLRIFRRLVLCAFFTIWGSVAFGLFLPTLSLSPYLRLGGNHGDWMAARGELHLGITGTVILLVTTLMVFCSIMFVTFLPAIRRALERAKLPQKTSLPPMDSPTEPLEEEEEDQPLDVLPDDDEPAYGEPEPQTQPDGPADEPQPAATPEPDEPEAETEPEDDELSETETPVTAGAAGNDTPVLTEDGFTVTAAGQAEGEEIIDKPLSQQLVEKYGLYDPTQDLAHYQFPTFDLLNQQEQAIEVNLEEQQANKNRIVEALSQYNISVKDIQATVGPTVTMYEIIPGDGVRIAKIKNLSDDIALSLSALGIRIIAPMPGKGTIGIEVPNKKPQMVPMYPIIASKKFQESDMELPLAIGKTITNEIFMVDLCKMPHLLVAGATGQGKSVGLNAILTSLLYKKHPSQLKVVLVDPKKVEFSIYSGIEHHFLTKIADEKEAILTDVQKVTRTLTSLCKEMDDRYDLLKQARVRNIREYNERFCKRELNPEKGHRYLPYIVVVIDEFGDLIMTAGKEVELPICRIAQLARAVGIHMIIATQRPTTDIISGRIKANFPARMAFRVMQAVDSKTILDRTGANQLIGRGDLLFSQGGDPIRVQCAFVDTPEIERICRFIGDQPGFLAPFCLPNVEESASDAEGTNLSGVDMTRRDPLFEEVARMVVLNQTGSTSYIQRKFSLGYNRAGRLMDQLEAAGIVGAADGSKSRQVLVQDELQLNNIMENMK
ncbi:MAG: DNA translocase FtsK [Paludibacteraceae bacterium]|nr:DNA translocase FtsK [Paludibacteraceae bacterium]